MSAAKGWRTRIILQGSPEDEEMIGSPASAGQTVFYTRSFPVVDALGNVTDDEAEVVVKKNGVTLATTDYTLEGATGKITLATAAADGDVLTCSYSYRHTLAYGRSGEVVVEGGLEGLYVLDSRLPKEILEGAVSIRGSLERYFVSRDFIGKLGSLDDEQAEFFVYLYPLGEESGKPYFTVGGVKFSVHTLSIPDPDEVITEKLEWMGTSITTGVVA
jgi:hypothetical protein